MSHDRFVSSFLAYGAAALRDLRGRYPPDKIPYRTYEKPVFHGGRFLLYHLRRVDPFPIVTSEWERLCELPEFGKLCKAFPFERTEHTRNELFSAFHAYLYSTRSLAFRKSTLARICNSYIRMWESKTVTVVTLCLLNGICIKGSALKLSPEVILRRLSGPEKTRLWTSFDIQMVPNVQAFDLMNVDAALEIRVRSSIEEFYGPVFSVHNAGRDLIPAAMTAIRLSADCPVGIRLVCTSFLPQPCWCIGGPYGPMYEFESVSHLTARMAAQHRRACKACYRYMQDKSRSTSLDLAIRWFNASYTKRMPDDVVLDLVIAMESCLGQGEKGESIGRSLRQRANAIVGARSKTVHEEIRDAYNVRCKLVHDGERLEKVLKKNKAISLSPADYATRLRQLVRIIIERYLRLTASKKMSVSQLNQEIDNALLNTAAKIDGRVL